MREASEISARCQAPERFNDPTNVAESSFTHMEFLYEEDTRVACRSCGWAGRPSDCWTDVHMAGEFYVVWCPRCDATIAHLPFASHGEIRDLAAAGNAKAISELGDLDRTEAFHDRARASQLKDPEQLPDLKGDALELIWDFEPGAEGEDNVTVIRHGDRELWREVAYWEGGDRFAAVFTILRRRYGWRLVSLVASGRSQLWLGGDRFTPDCRRAEAGFANLDRQASLDLRMESVTDDAGRTFHILRQGDLVVWRSPEPGSDRPTKEDVQQLQEMVRGWYRGRVGAVSLLGLTGAAAIRSGQMSEPRWRPSQQFADALAFANEKHADQGRKGSNDPYIGHLLAVCSLVIEDGGSEEEAIAALLHDVAEDQGGEPMLAEVETRFGPTVRRIVAACSDTFETPKPDWNTRKRDYVATMPDKQPDELRVSLADKVHNARSILFDFRKEGDGLWERFRADRRQVLWYYRALADVFVERIPGPLADELERVVGELETMVRLAAR